HPPTTPRPVTLPTTDDFKPTHLDIKNSGSERTTVPVRDGYPSRTTTLSLKPGEARTNHWSLSRTRGWYDLVIAAPGDPRLEYRYAGHVENGEGSITDPAMGGLL